MAFKDPVAVALARRRMTAMTPEERKKVAQAGAAARWKDHVAKRPASSRKKKSP